MNDRYRFRVWNSISKEFSHWSGFTFDFTGGGYDEDGNKIPLEPIVKASEYESDKQMLGGYGDVEQCTGLKDKNGKLIYENDIVRFSHPNKQLTERVYYIVFRDCNFAITAWNREDQNFWLGSKQINNLEVIGNIHENHDTLPEVAE